MQTESLKISGRVQGVGYRYYAQQLAAKYRINGTVRNMDDGRVHIIAQAEEDQLEAFKQALQVPNHRYMQINGIETQFIPESKIYENFKVIY